MIYSRKDNDINHLMDMAEFYKKNEELCVTDITSNIKIYIVCNNFCIRCQKGSN